MQIFLKYVKRSFNIIRRLSKHIPLTLDDSEELVRRCKKKVIRGNGRIHRNAFYFGYHKISVDRSKYRPYKKTLQEIPGNENINNWRLIKGTVRYIKLISGVEKVVADPTGNNLAHALIICDSNIKKRNEIAESLSAVFQKIPEEQYKV